MKSLMKEFFNCDTYVHCSSKERCKGNFTVVANIESSTKESDNKLVVVKYGNNAIYHYTIDQWIQMTMKEKIDTATAKLTGIQNEENAGYRIFAFVNVIDVVCDKYIKQVM